MILHVKKLRSLYYSTVSVSSIISQNTPRKQQRILLFLEAKHGAIQTPQEVQSNGRSSLVDSLIARLDSTLRTMMIVREWTGVPFIITA